MLEIFATNCPPLSKPAPLPSSRQINPLAASGTTLLFSTTFYPKEPPLFSFSVLSSFWNMLFVDKIPYAPAPPLNPWVEARALKVPKLPDPPFEASAPQGSMWPKTDICQDMPLMADTAENQPEPLAKELLEFARRQLPQQAVLSQEPNGEVYLKIPFACQEKLLPQLQEENIEPAALKIALISSQEWQEKQGWGPIAELGKEFSFSLEGLFTLKPLFHKEVERLWFFSIDAPMLQRLREKHFLSRRPFFLTLGKRKKSKGGPEEKKLFRINVSCYAA